ncbi:MAG: exodeoxyribonuclease VII large subunit [Patescibacteria group bacterium]
MKKRLTAEGIFAPERKRAIPMLPRRIGVVTSKEGAVIHDFINNLGKFGYEVMLVDSRVEGQQAVGPLLGAIRALKEKDIEVLVIIRGGGSLESLQAFNNEMLVRELASFPVPVIAGIGHDQDMPLVALMADAMTSTPTAVAHLLNRSWEDAYQRVRQFASVLTRVDDRIRRIRVDMDLALRTVVDRTTEMFSRAKERLAYAEKTMVLHSPERQLALGYSIARKHGKVIRSIEGIMEGDEISIRFSDGEANARVESKK